MHPNEQLISKFYSAFQVRGYLTMQSFYHPNATFYDPVFENLNADQVKAMWQMLTTTAKDIEIKCSKISADDHKGTCQWDAWYTFTATGKQVHNVIQASFEFKDGKIIKHHDQFDLYRWSRMAFGVTGVLLGWTPLLKNKIRKTAQGRLAKFMKEKYKVASIN